MAHLVKSFKGSGTKCIAIATSIFQRSFAQYLVLSTSEVSNDFEKYLLRYSRFRYCLQTVVHKMTSRILSILIDFSQDRAANSAINFKSLNFYNSGTRTDNKKRSTAIFLVFNALSNRAIKFFISVAL